MRQHRHANQCSLAQIIANAALALFGGLVRVVITDTCCSILVIWPDRPLPVHWRVNFTTSDRASRVAYRLVIVDHERLFWMIERSFLIHVLHRVRPPLP